MVRKKGSGSLCRDKEREKTQESDHVDMGGSSDEGRYCGFRNVCITLLKCWERLLYECQAAMV